MRKKGENNVELAGTTAIHSTPTMISVLVSKVNPSQDSSRTQPCVCGRGSPARFLISSDGTIPLWRRSRAPRRF